MEIADLIEERLRVVGQMRSMVKAGAHRDGGMTAEECAKHEELFEIQERLRARIAAAERSASAAREYGGDSVELRAFSRWLRNAHLRADEIRALGAGDDVQGGYLKAPGEFVAQLLGDIDDLVFVRARATVRPVRASSTLGIPTIETQPNDADWVTEWTIGSEDTAMRFGKRQLKPSAIAKLVKVTKALLRAGGVPAEQVVRERCAYKVGVTLEKAYLTGNGASRPLGVFTASDAGIPTSRDVSTGNTATSITADGLREARYSLKSQYWRGAAWIFHRDAVKQISKLKDGDGDYLWRPSERDGEPDRLLGHPVFASEYAPSTFTTGSYVGVIGDFKFYHIADALEFNVQRLIELYAESHLDGFVVRYEGDGMPALGEAFARVQLG